MANEPKRPPDDLDAEYQELLRREAERDGDTVEAFLGKGRQLYSDMFEAALARANRRGVSIEDLYQHDRALIQHSEYPSPSCLQPHEVELFASGALSAERTSHVTGCQGCTLLLEGVRPSHERAESWAKEVQKTIRAGRQTTRAVSPAKPGWRVDIRQRMKPAWHRFAWGPAIAGAAAAWIIAVPITFQLFSSTRHQEQTLRQNLSNAEIQRAMLQSRVDASSTLVEAARTLVESDASRAASIEKELRIVRSRDASRAKGETAERLLAFVPEASHNGSIRVTASRVADAFASSAILTSATSVADSAREGVSSVLFERFFLDVARNECEQLPAEAGRDELKQHFAELRNAFESRDTTAWTKPYLTVHRYVEGQLQKLAKEKPRPESPVAPSQTDSDPAANHLKQCDIYLEKFASLRLARPVPDQLRATTIAMPALYR